MKQDTLLMFDLDGTLWDSAQAVAESWNEVFRKTDPSLRDRAAFRPRFTRLPLRTLTGLSSLC